MAFISALGLPVTSSWRVVHLRSPLTWPECIRTIAEEIAGYGFSYHICQGVAELDTSVVPIRQDVTVKRKLRVILVGDKDRSRKIGICPSEEPAGVLYLLHDDGKHVDLSQQRVLPVKAIWLGDLTSKLLVEQLLELDTHRNNRLRFLVAQS